MFSFDGILVPLLQNEQPQLAAVQTATKRLLLSIAIVIPSSKRAKAPRVRFDSKDSALYWSAWDPSSTSRENKKRRNSSDSLSHE